MGQHKRKEVKQEVVKREYCNGCPHIRRVKWCDLRWRGYRFYCYKYFDSLNYTYSSQIGERGKMNIELCAECRRKQAERSDHNAIG